MSNPRYNNQTANTRVCRGSGSPKSGEKSMKKKNIKVFQNYLKLFKLK